MFTIIKYELFGFLRSWRAVAMAGALQAGLLLFILSIWPDRNAGLASDMVGRVVIHDFLEKLLILLMAISPVVTASAFARERQQSTLHLLVLTRLSPWSIVMGKLVASTAFLLILLVSSLPALVLVFQVGGVPPRVIAEVYLLLAVTIIYCGAIGLFVSLHCQTTAQAFTLTAVVLVALNLVFPSIQLYSGIISNYFAPGGGYEMGEYIDLFPAPELLFSTPQFPHYYVIDLFSPFSVYCNFRFVQLDEVRPNRLLFNRVYDPAGDLQMILHFTAVAGITTLLLLSGCVARLKRMSAATALYRPEAFTAIRGRIHGYTPERMLLLGLLGALALRVTLDLFDVTPPRQSTLLMMWVAVILMGGAGADSVAMVAERQGLRLEAISMAGAARFFHRALAPAFIRLLFVAVGFASGLLLSSSIFGAAGIQLHPVGLFVVVQSFMAIMIAGILAGCIGAVISAWTLKLAPTRVAVFSAMFVAWLLSLSGAGEPPDPRMMSELGLSTPVGIIVGSILALKYGMFGLVQFLNPFELATFPSRGLLRSLPPVSILWLAVQSLAILSFAYTLLLMARHRLVSREYFHP